MSKFLVVFELLSNAAYSSWSQNDCIWKSFLQEHSEIVFAGLFYDEKSKDVTGGVWLVDGVSRVCLESLIDNLQTRCECDHAFRIECIDSPRMYDYVYSCAC